MPQRVVRDASVNQGVIHCSWSDKWLRPGGGSSSCELVQSQFSAAVQQRQPVGDKRATTRPVATSVSPRLIVCSRRAGAALHTSATYWQVFCGIFKLSIRRPSHDDKELGLLPVSEILQPQQAASSVFCSRRRAIQK